MKKLTIILALTLISGYAVSQTSIFSVLSMKQEIEYKTKRPKKIVESTIFYNSNGKRIEKIDKRTKTSDDIGIAFVEERSDEMGTRFRLTYVSDTINRVQVARILEQWYHWGGYSKVTAFYSYDERKFLVNCTDMDDNGKVMFVSFILNNEYGDPIGLSLVDGNGNLYGKESAIYDYDRNVVIERVFSNKGALLSSNKWPIDVSKIYFGKKHRNFYNEQGYLIKSVNVRGKKGYLHEYTYDIYGNCTEHRIYKVSFKKNGKEKKTICRIYRKEYTY